MTQQEDKRGFLLPYSVEIHLGFRCFPTHHIYSLHSFWGIMTKETLPFTRGHEKHGFIYSLDISCLASESRQTTLPINKAITVPVWGARVSACSATCWVPKGQEKKEDLLSAVLCLRPKIHMPFKQFMEDYRQMSNWKLQAKTSGVESEKIKVI